VNANAQITCSVVTNSWNNGYIANVTVSNSGDTVLNGWSVVLSVSEESSVLNYWGAEFTSSETSVIANNVAWNASLYPGQVASFGFVGSHNGDFQAPRCFADPHEAALAGYLKDGLLNHLGIRQQYYYSNGSSSSSTSSSTGTTSASSSSSSASSSASSASSSTGGTGAADDDITNTQEIGVDEADIIESDGSHFYVVSKSSVGSSSSSSTTSSSSSSTSSGSASSAKPEITLTAYAIDKDNATTDVVGTLEIPYEDAILDVSGTYLRQNDSGKLLAVVGNARDQHSYGWTYYYGGNYPYYQVSKNVSITIANIDDPAAMTEVEKLRFDGELVSSRRIDNMLYVAMRYSPNLARLGFELGSSANSAIEANRSVTEAASLDDLLPHMYDEDGNSTPLFSADACSIPEWPQEVDAYAGSLLVLTQINLDDTNEISSRCLPASVQDIYSSQNAIYAFGRADNGGTKIHKLAVSEDLAYRGSVVLAGRIPCGVASYCFGEKDDLLRVLYSANTTTLATDTPFRLAVIEESDDSVGGLNVVATLPNHDRPQSIGKPREQIYAMRSFGDHVYIVTFERVDPLYAIDLSDPLDPYIAGEVEVEGFSAYLHPVGENLLVGVGQHAIFDEVQGVTRFQGVKVELFDISDPTMLRSIGSEIIGERSSTTNVSTDPRGFALRNDENGIRFTLPIEVHDRLPEGGDPESLSQWYYWSHTGLYVYEIETDPQADAQLSRLGVLVAEEYSGASYYPSGSIRMDRGVLYGNAVFYLHDFGMHSSLIEALQQP